MPTSEWYQAKAYHDHDIPRNCPLFVVVEDELYTPEEVELYHLPKTWFRRICVKEEDIYVFFGARYPSENCYTVLEEDCT